MKPVIKSTTPDGIISELESQGYGWDIGHTGVLRECRIWKWPYVVGRYQSSVARPIAEQLMAAIGTIDGEFK